jgi:predicted RNA-binding Zn-ribbon protein involved in translation (DUF1610 family)
VKGRPRFFCEHCGAEVSRDAKNCPRCGRFFASVKCPSCGFVGAEELFQNGCPICGYSTSPDGRAVNSNLTKGETAGALPSWVYLITLAALIAVLGALFFTLSAGR